MPLIVFFNKKDGNKIEILTSKKSGVSICILFATINKLTSNFKLCCFSQIEKKLFKKTTLKHKYSCQNRDNVKSLNVLGTKKSNLLLLL